MSKQANDSIVIITTSIFFILIQLFFFFSVLYKIIEINSTGVKYISLKKKCVIRWSDIKNIGITNCVITRQPMLALYFTTKPLDLYNSSYFENLKIHPDHISNDFIMMLNVNRNVIKEVNKHWNGKIVGLYYLK